MLSEEYRKKKRAKLEKVLEAAKIASKHLDWKVHARTLELGVIKIK